MRQNSVYVKDGQNHWISIRQSRDDMKGYAIGLLTDVILGEGIVSYLQGIDATLEPYNGCFIIHGALPTVLEGEFKSDVIVIEFPSKQYAMDWYRSQAYQKIAHLRKDNSKGHIFIIEDVDPNHLATDILKG